MSDRELDEDDVAMLHALGRHANAHRLEDFLAQGARCGWCAHPIRLRGYVLGGEERRGGLLEPRRSPTTWCSKRVDRAANCAALVCAPLSRRRPSSGAGRARRRQGRRRVGRRPSGGLHDPDRSGLRGGAPGNLARCMPSAERARRCPHGRRLTCEAGTPGRRAPSARRLSPVLRLRRRRLHNASGRRAVAAHHDLHRPPTGERPSGSHVRQCAKVLRLEHCKVAEFQRRGLVHFHAVIRADGPGRSATPDRRSGLGPGLPGGGAQRGGVPRPGHGPLGERGRRPGPRHRSPGDPVAPYVAKYATKEPAMHPGLLSRILSESDLEEPWTSRRTSSTWCATAWTLGGVPELQLPRSPASRPSSRVQRSLPHQVPRLLDHLRRLA